MTREDWAKLSSEKKLIAIARCIPDTYKVEDRPDGVYITMYQFKGDEIGTAGWGVGILPDYLDDLNATHELEELLGDRQQKESYGWALAGIVHCGDDKEEDYDGIDTCVLKDDIDFLFHSTAAQRAEAFVLTMDSE
jgi:hypothetical protein